jgi:integrase
LRQTPKADRRGFVLLVPHFRTGRQLSAVRVGRVLSDVGRKAEIEVGEGKFASAHDIRRAFGSRWAKSLAPAMLMALMRHENIQTTMRYYVDHDADELASAMEAVWGNSWGNEASQSS